VPGTRISHTWIQVIQYCPAFSIQRCSFLIQHADDIVQHIFRNNYPQPQQSQLLLNLSFYQLLDTFHFLFTPVSFLHIHTQSNRTTQLTPQTFVLLPPLSHISPGFCSLHTLSLFFSWRKLQPTDSSKWYILCRTMLLLMHQSYSSFSSLSQSVFCLSCTWDPLSSSFIGMRKVTVFSAWVLFSSVALLNFFWNWFLQCC